MEDLIRICKKYNKIAYITVRDKQIQTCVDEIFRLLEKYDMLNNCILNSFSIDTLKAIREKDANIKISCVFGPNKILTKKHVEKAAALGNCAICVFWFKDVLIAGEKLKKSAKAMQYATEKGIELHYAQSHDAEGYSFGILSGFKAFQCSTSFAFK